MPPPGVCMSIMQERHKKEGVGSLANPEKHSNQDFQQLTQYCLARGVRYIDEMFPPDHNSIGDGLLSPDDMGRVVWLRPAKMVQYPDFIVDGLSRFDFGQGMVGDCWFLASIGALTFQEHILEQVVPLKQSFKEDYCGIFHFRFWRFGRWVDVVIDDKLPTVDGRLVFVHSKTPNEFWPALLEKAYAKVCGSYADMNAGTPSEAMMDFTGGVHITVKLTDAPPNLWDLLFRAAKSKSLIGCGTPQGETSANTVTPNGLVRGHAYTVTGVKQVMSQGMVVNLIRLFNPWGRGEWKGDWSDKSSMWQTVSPDDRKMCLSVEEDGEFWMTMKHFCEHFADVDICYSFWTNPQYRVKIGGLSGNCSETQGDNNMLVSLMQKPDKRNRCLVKSLHIGFSIFEFKGQSGKFSASFFSNNVPVAQSKNYLNAREVMEFFRLKPGEYLIVPSTFKPNETASFILSILSKAETHIHENSNDQDMEDILFSPKTPKFEVVNAEQLQSCLNENLIQGNTKKTQGFSLESCRSMVALMDTSITGKLNVAEFLRLWRKVTEYKDIFFRTDVDRSGMLSLSELRNAIMASGIRVGDDMLNLMALRYGGSSGNISLESFISLVLRMNCMANIFRQLNDGGVISLQENEWMYISMYT
ncbi:calpain-1 catalytic subunit-like [Salvelinus namaycush]|uniref:Calpain-1 catalytic subunit-like n=1 Tax=Salvelinus namaycush TaxID=8040 RepID=A0A8U0PDJ7_SALNM|nr:calpain-1 catalytic subunit-like [Salvelinus namaycush]